MEHWSARKWFARILITWGLISSATAFVKTPMQFYIVRFLLGLAEAGFFPGIIVYFTHWFSSHDRARAMSGLILAVPCSLALGAPVSGLLLNLSWLGLVGWQWLFVIEGLPAIVLGIVTLVCMTDRPRHAKWLTAAERDYLEGVLAAESHAKDALGKVTIWQALRERNVWLLAFGIFVANTGGYALTFWLPTTVKSISGSTVQATLYYSGLFYTCGIVSVLFSGQSSDRSGDRKWHCVAGLAATAVFLIGSTIPGQPFAIVMSWLCFTGLAAFFWPSPFWALPTLTLGASAAAVAVGFINMCANVAGYLGNHLLGWMRTRGFGDSACLVFLASCYLLSAVILSFLKDRSAASGPQEPIPSAHASRS